MALPKFTGILQEIVAWVNHTLIPAIEALLGLTNVFRTESYTALVVTVPAPTVAPTVSTPTVTLGTFGVQPGNAAFTAGHIYQVAITFNGRTGESLIGTVVASFTATTGQGLAVHPNAPDTTLAASANIYIKNTSGDNTWRRASDASGAVENNNCGFGDGDSAVGGMVVKYNAAGAAPPGASTATKPDGVTALGETPNLAPTLKTITALLSGLGALYFSYSWVTENGETALSPFSSGVTAPSATIGAWMPLYVEHTPPAGAVAIRIYAGTAATEAAMKLQAENPIWWVRHPIHSFNASGAAHVTATPTSTLSALQQAYDAALVVGGGTVVVPSILETKVPLIFGNPGSNKFAIRITGEGGNNASYTSSQSKTRVDYTGTKTGATLVLIATSTLILEHIDFADPNGRVKYGHVTSDFEGGQGHNNRVNHCTFRAMEAGGLGIVCKTNSSNSGSHTSDNCVFDQVTAFADAWAVDLAGNQTLEYQFRHLGTHVFNSANTANSGTIRCAVQTLQFNGVGGTEIGHYFFYLTNEYLDPFSTGAKLNADEVYDESVDTRKFLYTSPLDVNGSGFILGAIYKVNQSGVQIYGYLFDNQTRGQVRATYSMAPDVYSYSNSVSGQLEDGIYPSQYNVRPTWGTRGTSATSYIRPVSEILSGALGFRNATDQLSTIGTSANGDLDLFSASGLAKLKPILFANLGTPVDGVLAFCSDGTAGDPLTGSGSGCLAIRQSGAWVGLDVSGGGGTTPLVIGGTSTTATLTLQPTSGVGDAGADIIFKVGNNGATEVMRILNDGDVGIGTASPETSLQIAKDTTASSNGFVETEAQLVLTNKTTPAKRIHVGYDASIDKGFLQAGHAGVAFKDIILSPHGGAVDTGGVYKVDGTQVVGNRGAAVIDATDAASAITQLNALLARCRAHGLIA